MALGTLGPALVNTVYLKASWAQPFLPGLTRDGQPRPIG